jgi:glycosyltransferase involved in cell wall biosynthesis
MTSPVVCAAFLDDHLSQGGTTTFLVKLLPALREFGIPSTVIASDHRTERAAAIDHAGISRLSYPNGDSSWLYDDRLLGAYRLLAECKPQAVVASHETISFDLLRYVPAGVLRIGIIHVDDEWSYRLVSFYAHQLDMVVCPTLAIAERAKALLPPLGPRVEIIPYGVGLPPEVSPAVQADGDTLRLLYVGRLDEGQKRVRRFVPLWRELKKRPRPILWTLVGDGPEANYLKENMPSDERHRVEFALGREYEELPRFYSSHHAILLLSDYEGLPLTLLEGMSHGLVPVVSDRLGGISDLVDAGNGLSVPPDEPEKFAAALDQLRPGEPSFARLRSAARERICANYSLESMAARWARLIRGQTPLEAPRWPEKIRFQGPPERRTRLPAWYFSAPLRPLRRAAHRAVQCWRQRGA